MHALTMKSIMVRCLFTIAVSTGVLRAAAGDVTPLSRSEIRQVETVLTKNLKGKPTVQSGTKQEVDGGWKISCVATIGSGGAYDLVVMTEKSLTLGYIDSQKPHMESAAAKAPAAKGVGKK